MKAKKIFCLILAVIMVCGVLVACAGNDGEEGKSSTKSGGQEALEYAADIPEGTTFGNATFNVMSIDPGLYPSMLTAFDFESDQDEVVSAAIFKRNRRIEDNYKVVFKTTYLDIADTYPKLIETVGSGIEEYQLMMLICREAFPAVLDEYALLSDQLPYVNLDQPWYNKSVNESMELCGMPILAYTDECLNLYLQNECFFFNADIVKDKQLDNPYDLVEAGTWTIENLYRLAEEAMDDVNGDTYYSVVDGDIFGIISENDHFYPSMWVGAGIQTITKNKDGEPVYKADGNEKLIDVLDGLTDIITTEGFYCNSDICFADIDNVGDTRRDAATQYFTHNGGLFRSGVVGYVNLLRNMNANFGILPLAKYDEAQDEYYSRVIDGWLHIVPSNVSNKELCGAMLEALGAESKNFVIPAFFDEALDSKYVRDEGREQTEKSLNIIFNNGINDLGDTIWLMQVRGPLCMAIDAGDNTFSSRLSQIKSKVKMLCIDETVDKLETLKKSIG